MSVAKQIRVILKAKFPTVKFSVTSEKRAVNVNASKDSGLEYSQIMNEIKHFEMGRFDSSTDMYEITNLRNDVPQVQYVFVNLIND